MFGKIKAAATSATQGLLEVIDWPDFHPDQILKRVPDNGPGDIRFGAQLIVREGLTAVFYRDGKPMDTFGPGRHTLSTANLPLVEGAVRHVTGGHNVFTAEVYYVNQRPMTDLKWGTPNPIDMKDPDLGWVQLRAFGKFTVRVEDAKLFVDTIGHKYPTSTTLNQFLKASVRTHLNDLVGTTFESYAKIRSSVEELAAAMKVKVRDDFGKYGIEVRDFFVEDVSVPEEIQEAFRMRAKMGALGLQGPQAYTQFQAANAMTKMAENEGTGGAMMQAGMGMGMGMMFPQMMNQAMAPHGYPPQGYGYPPQGGYPPPGYPPQGYPPQGGYPPPQGGYPPQQGYPPQGAPPPQAMAQGAAAGAAASAGSDIQAKIAKLQELKDLGVLTEEEFQQKVQLLQSL